MQRLRKARDDQGFTLIELLIVVIILAVLAAIVVFAVGQFASRGKRAACRTDYKTVETAQEARKAEKGSYATSTGALVTDGYLREAPPPPPATDTKPYGISTANTGVVTVSVWNGTAAVSGTTSVTCDQAN